jgi:hypothetical protein
MLMRKAYGARGSAVLEIGNAVDLDGSTEYLNIPDGAFMSGATSITISVWVYLRSFTAYGGIIRSRVLSGSPIGIDQNATANKSLYINLSSVTFETPNSSISTGIWTHVVAGWSISNVVTCIINGVSYTGAVGSIALANQGGFSPNIGYDDNNALRKTNGKFDELAIWVNRELSYSEKMDLYNSGAGMKVTTSGVFPSTGVSIGTRLSKLIHFDESGSATNALEEITPSLSAVGVNIGTGDWVQGKVPK